MLEFINDNRGDLQYIASLIVGLAMWRWGGGPERASASVFVGLIIIPVMIFSLAFNNMMLMSDYAAIYVMFDALALIAFGWIALNANRNYPMCLAALQLVAMFAHALRLLGDVVSPLAYAILAIGPSYGQLALLIIGLVRHSGRRRVYGDYREWRIGHFQPQIADIFSSRTMHRQFE